MFSFIFKFMMPFSEYYQKHKSLFILFDQKDIRDFVL